MKPSRIYEICSNHNVYQVNMADDMDEDDERNLQNEEENEEENQELNDDDIDEDEEDSPLEEGDGTNEAKSDLRIIWECFLGKTLYRPCRSYDVPESPHSWNDALTFLA